MTQAASFKKLLIQAKRLHASGKLREAEAAFSALLQSHGQNAEAVTELAKTAAEMGEIEAALSLFQRAASLAPRVSAAHYNLGKALKSAGGIEAAIQAYRKAITLDPKAAEAHYNLANALGDMGRISDAVAAYRQAVDLKPESDLYWSNLLLALNYLDPADPEEVFKLHRQWGTMRESGRKDGGTKPSANDADSERKLVVGYLSPDFHAHSVSYFFEEICANHDRRGFKIIAYDNQIGGDEVTKRLKPRFDVWRPIRELSDERAFKLIRSDKVDILVDLAGHSQNNRLALFARKPAPVQVSWIGYPNTTGLAAVDWRLTDSFADPEGLTDRFFTERLYRLPHGFLCYRPPANAPNVAPRRADGIVFGCFNNLSKIGNDVLDVWASILARLPDAKLIVKNGVFKSPDAVADMARRLTARRIEAERFALLPPAKETSDHLATYNQIDVALDSYPYSGTTTTCEALWMGVPVVTLAGDQHLSRVSAAILRRLGLQELIGATPSEYADIAVLLAQDPERLKALKAGLRDRMKDAPLLNGALIARSVEDAYRFFWKGRQAAYPAIPATQSAIAKHEVNPGDSIP